MGVGFHLVLIGLNFLCGSLIESGQCGREQPSASSLPSKETCLEILTSLLPLLFSPPFSGENDPENTYVGQVSRMA